MRHMVLWPALLAACDNTETDSRIDALSARVDELEIINEELRQRLITAEGSITDNTDEISLINGTVDLSELATDVDSLETGLVETNTRLTQLEATGLATEDWVTSRGYATQADLFLLSGEIDDVQSTVTANSTAILTNAADISTNASSISTNATAIGANQSSIKTNATAIGANQSSIATNTSGLSSLTTTVTGLQTELSTLESDVTALDSQLSTLDSDVTTLGSDVTTLDSQLTTLDEAVVTLDADLDAVDASVGDLENDVGCPSDMVDAGGYCIDTDENSSQNWQAHANLCQSEGKRMCSLAEWIGACNDRSALGLNDMIDGNYEYVDEYWVMNYTNGNYYSSYVSVGNTSCSRIYYSGWGCTNSTCYDTTNAGDSYVSRCCR